MSIPAPSWTVAFKEAKRWKDRCNGIETVHSAQLMFYVSEQSLPNLFTHVENRRAHRLVPALLAVIHIGK